MLFRLLNNKLCCVCIESENRNEFLCPEMNTVNVGLHLSCGMSCVRVLTRGPFLKSSYERFLLYKYLNLC